jgi:hypothetical protein
LLLTAKNPELLRGTLLLLHGTHNTVGGDAGRHKERCISEYGIDLVLTPLERTTGCTLFEMLLQRRDIRLR